MPTPVQSDLYPLPIENDARHICVTLSIPGDTESISNFIGALWRLSLWNNYRRDNAKRGKIIADVWRDVIEGITFSECKPDIIPAKSGIYEDFEMPIRVDCDCKVWVTCCDGTEVQLATVGMINNPTQPGSGAPQPTPGGGTAEYSGCCDASGIWLLPVPLSTGDVVSVSNVKGSWTGNSGATWNCPDGEYYFAGACVGGGTLSGSDPIPSSNHMRLIMFLDGDYYDLMAGDVVVPSGVDTVQGWFQANDDDLSGNSGAVCFEVTVTNNQSTGAWSHYFDFKTAPLWESYARSEHGGSCTGGATWAPSQGWKDVPCVPQTANYLDTRIVFSPSDISSFSVTFENNTAFDSSSDIDIYIVDGSGETLVAQIIAPGSGVGTISATGAWTAVTELRFRSSIDGLTNHTVQLSATVTGPNSNPF